MYERTTFEHNFHEWKSHAAAKTVGAIKKAKQTERETVGEGKKRPYEIHAQPTHFSLLTFVLARGSWDSKGVIPQDFTLLSALARGRPAGMLQGSAQGKIERLFNKLHFLSAVSIQRKHAYFKRISLIIKTHTKNIYIYLYIILRNICYNMKSFKHLFIYASVNTKV